MKKIITHGGSSAHFDDYHSVCMQLSRDKEIVKIERREPTEEELEDPRCYVLDVGKRYEPEKNNIDHHQKPSDDSTISLLLKLWGLWEKAIEVYPSIETAVLFDARGGNYILEKYQIRPHIISAFSCYANEFILQKFGKYDVITDDDPFFHFMRESGDYFFSSIEEYFEIKEDIIKNARFERIKRIPVIVYDKDIENKDLMCKIMSRIKREKWGRGGISISITDRPKNALAVHRYDDDYRVDFTRIPKKTQGVHFIHPSGFFMAVTPSCEYELFEMIKVAIV